MTRRVAHLPPLLCVVFKTYHPPPPSINKTPPRSASRHPRHQQQRQSYPSGSPGNCSSPLRKISPISFSASPTTMIHQFLSPTMPFATSSSSELSASCPRHWRPEHQQFPSMPKTPERRATLVCPEYGMNLTRGWPGQSSVAFSSHKHYLFVNRVEIQFDSLRTVDSLVSSHLELRAKMFISPMR